MLPLFLEMNLLRLVGSPWSVILPTALFPFGVYLAYVFYVTSIPRELSLAAGASMAARSGSSSGRSVCPLSSTLIGLLTFLSFTTNWNNYFLPFVMLHDDEKYTLAVGLQALVAGTPMVAMSRIQRHQLAAQAPRGRAHRACSWCCR